MILEPNWPFEVARQKKDSLVALIGMLNCIGAALNRPLSSEVHAIIGPNGGGKDIFVHISAVERAGLSSLNEGQVVQYEEVSNRGRSAAENLRISQ